MRNKMKKEKLIINFIFSLCPVSLFLALFLSSCGPSKEELEAELAKNCMTKTIYIKVKGGWGEEIVETCTKIKLDGRPFNETAYLRDGKLYNYWGQEIAKGVESFTIVLPDSLNNSLDTINKPFKSLSSENYIYSLRLPSNYHDISRDERRPDQMNVFVRNDTLIFSFR